MRCYEVLIRSVVIATRWYGVTDKTNAVPSSELNPIPPSVDPTVELARRFLRHANLPNFALDRLSRYEATLWRQAGQILHAVDALDRRKPQERIPRPFRC